MLKNYCISDLEKIKLSAIPPGTTVLHVFLTYEIVQI